jgi:hypothetical protein
MDEKQPQAFAVMPISDPSDYETGHFQRVYDYLIKPACANAGLNVVRADDIKSTNYIVLDILNRIISSNLVICDLSSKNPNVFYELGIRQAFDLPVVLIKDRKTDRVFDIQGLRTIDYDSNMRIDSVQRDIANIANAIRETVSPSETDVNSLVSLLGLQKAQLSTKPDISAETRLIINSIGELSHRLSQIEDQTIQPDSFLKPSVPKVVHYSSNHLAMLPNGEQLKIGEKIYTLKDGSFVGILKEINSQGLLVSQENGADAFIPNYSSMMSAIGPRQA